MFNLTKLFKMNRTNNLVFLALLYPAIAFSISSDKEIYIQSDYMKLDIETGSSIYTGNVSIIQGTITLTGEKVVLTRKDNEVQNINIDGNPARYLQDENTGSKVHAISQHMQYIASTHRLILTKNASLEQSDQTVKSERIVYDTKNKAIIAGKNVTTENTKPGGSRVNIILTPNKETQSGEENKK